MKEAMNASEWAGWVGACGSLLSLGWQVYTKVTTGPRLRLFVEANFVKRTAGSKQVTVPSRDAHALPGEPKLLRITVENRGNAPTTIQGLVFETYPSRWARFRRRASTPYGDIPEADEGHQLPYPLDVGREFVAHIEQDKEFDKWASSGTLWCGVVHSFSTRPVLGKVSYPK